MSEKLVGQAAPIIRAYEGRFPSIDPSAWVAPGATLVGNVELGPDSSVWYGCVLRGDVERIQIGSETNIQDLSMVHVTAGRFPALIGDRVTVGHRAVIHGCCVGEEALIGIGAVVLDGAEIGAGALVAAGAVVTPGSVIEPHSLAVGIPARVVRELTEAERNEQVARTLTYVETARKHRAAETA